MGEASSRGASSHDDVEVSLASGTSQAAMQSPFGAEARPVDLPPEAG